MEKNTAGGHMQEQLKKLSLLYKLEVKDDLISQELEKVEKIKNHTRFSELFKYNDRYFSVKSGKELHEDFKKELEKKLNSLEESEKAKYNDLNHYLIENYKVRHEIKKEGKIWLTEDAHDIVDFKTDEKTGKIVGLKIEPKIRIGFYFLEIV